MVTRGGLYPALFAVECFRRQTYAHRELVIVCDNLDAPLKQAAAALGDGRIRWVEARAAPLGTLRNISVEAAWGNYVAQWDDDDLYHPQHLAWQFAGLTGSSAQACFIRQWIMWWPARRQLALSAKRLWEGSILARKAGLPAYPALARGEDTVLVKQLASARAVVTIEQPTAYCYIVHGRNSFDDAHMEMLFANAASIADRAEYDGSLVTLSATLPCADYAKWLGQNSSTI
jgi:glycosyltransferase involved in cell wall biosynthesis